MTRRFKLLLGGLMCTLAVGCSPYIGDFQYTPRPAVAALGPPGQLPPPPASQPGTDQPQPQPQQPPAMAVLATVIGLHRADRGLQIPDSVEIRLRIDNNGPDNVVFPPSTLQLSNGQLTPFAPVISQTDPVALGPQQTAYITAYFPFGPGHGLSDTDMSELQLHWQVQIGGQRVGQMADFHRVWPYYYGPYYYAPYYAYPAYPVVGLRVGVGFGGRWR